MTNLNIGDLVEFNQNFGSRRIGDRGIVEAIQYDGGDNTLTLIMEKENSVGSKICCPFAYRVTRVEKSETPAVPEARKGLIEMVKATSERVGTRNRNAILHSLVEELGELHTEVAIENGTKKREASPDGVVGEAIDVLVVILDLLHLELGEKITSQAFLDRVQSKLNKWEAKASNMGG